MEHLGALDNIASLGSPAAMMCKCYLIPRANVTIFVGWVGLGSHPCCVKESYAICFPLSADIRPCHDSDGLQRNSVSTLTITADGEILGRRVNAIGNANPTQFALIFAAIQ